MRRIHSLLLAAVVGCLAFAAAPCEAGILMETVSGIKTTPKTYDGFDSLFKADKVTEGELNPDDFTFYVATTDPNANIAFSYRWIDPDNHCLNLGSYNFVEVDRAQDIIDEPIAGFIYHGTADIDTYLVKAGTSYSVWKYEPGFNLAFLDLDGQEGGYPWDPNSKRTKGKNGDANISDVSFFGSPGDPVLSTPDPGVSVLSTPEPGTFLMFGIGAILAGGIARRRKTPR